MSIPEICSALDLEKEPTHLKRKLDTLQSQLPSNVALFYPPNVQTTSTSQKIEVSTQIVPTYIPKPSMHLIGKDLLERFIQICQHHEMYILQSQWADDFILATALWYIEQSNIAPYEFTTLTWTAAMYLAIEYHEDERSGLIELLNFVFGSSSSKYSRYRNTLIFKLHSKKNRIWKCLGFNISISKHVLDHVIHDMMIQSVPYFNIERTEIQYSTK